MNPRGRMTFADNQFEDRFYSRDLRNGGFDILPHFATSEITFEM